MNGKAGDVRRPIELGSGWEMGDADSRFALTVGYNPPPTGNGGKGWRQSREGHVSW